MGATSSVSSVATASWRFGSNGAGGVDRDQAVPLPELAELLADDHDALAEVALEVRRPRVLERPLEVVQDRQEVVDETGERDLEVLLPLALAALLVVLELRELADVAVLELLEVLLDRAQLLLGAAVSAAASSWASAASSESPESSTSIRSSSRRRDRDPARSFATPRPARVLAPVEPVGDGAARAARRRG